MSEGTQKHAGGRPSFRLYVIPGRGELTLAELKSQFPAGEVQTIVKRCQRHAAGYSIKRIDPPNDKKAKLPERLSHLKDLVKPPRNLPRDIQQ